MTGRTIKVRAVIPHYFCEADSPVKEIGVGFGSRRPGGRLSRSIAFSRCLHGLLNLRRSTNDLQLDHRSAAGVVTPSSTDFEQIIIEVVVVANRDAFLLDVIAPLVPQVQVLRCDLDDPRELGLAARDWLIGHTAPADLNLYLEDDLVIHDPLFVDKILWMAQCSNQRFVLLPHRYELTHRLDLPPRLLIDGTIDHDVFNAWHRPCADIATGSFRGQEGLRFDCPSNPHSGFFGISRLQLMALRDCELPRTGFVGPLETAATYTVGSAFTLLKPALINRGFLMIEHGHPSYLGYLHSDR